MNNKKNNIDKFKDAESKNVEKNDLGEKCGCHCYEGDGEKTTLEGLWGKSCDQFSEPDNGPCIDEPDPNSGECTRTTLTTGSTCKEFQETVNHFIKDEGDATLIHCEPSPESTGFNYNSVATEKSTNYLKYDSPTHPADQHRFGVSGLKCESVPSNIGDTLFQKGCDPAKDGDCYGYNMQFQNSSFDGGLSLWNPARKPANIDSNGFIEGRAPVSNFCEENTLTGKVCGSKQAIWGGFCEKDNDCPIKAPGSCDTFSKRCIAGISDATVPKKEMTGETILYSKNQDIDIYKPNNKKITCGGEFKYGDGMSPAIAKGQPIFSRSSWWSAVPGARRQPYHQRPPLWANHPETVLNTQKTLGIPSHGTGGLSGACSDHKTWIYPMGPWGFRGRLQGDGGNLLSQISDQAAAQPQGWSGWASTQTWPSPSGNYLTKYDTQASSRPDGINQFLKETGQGKRGAGICMGKNVIQWGEGRGGERWTPPDEKSHNPFSPNAVTIRSDNPSDFFGEHVSKYIQPLMGKITKYTRKVYDPKAPAVFVGTNEETGASYSWNASDATFYVRASGGREGLENTEYISCNDDFDCQNPANMLGATTILLEDKHLYNSPSGIDLTVDLKDLCLGPDICGGFGQRRGGEAGGTELCHTGHTGNKSFSSGYTNVLMPACGMLCGAGRQ